jgi:lipoprotein-anchoring transpeptidase ErfK/SrfK
MRRICVSVLLASALCVPAWADPLQITPNPANAGELQNPYGQTVPAPAASASAAAPAPVAVASAQPDLGGGFIQFLFGGPKQLPAAPIAGEGASAQQYAALSPDPGTTPDATAVAAAEHPPVPAKYDRQEVAYDGPEKPGTIIIDTPHKFLYLIEAGGKALRYGIGVGRPGFTWAGVKTVSAKREWPDWRPPAAMLKRQPELPRFMAGGPQNPLGARALYLGSTEYRIHGSNEPWTIGHDVSSGCIRLRNADIIDLYNRVPVGTKVVVM